MRQPNDSELARTRKLLGMNQEDFADLIGVSKDAIASIETGRMNYSDKMRMRVASVTGGDMRRVIEASVARHRERLERGALAFFTVPKAHLHPSKEPHYEER